MSPIQWSRANTPVWALVSGLPHRARIARDLFMLQCFVDESGNGHGPVMVMVGLISDVQSWADFSDEWQECLDMRPRLASFHMAEIADLSWGDETKERVARFRKIITKHVKGSVIVSLPLEPYRLIFGKEGPWRNPYLFLFFILIRDYRHHCQKIGLTREADFIFDKQLGAYSRVAEAWEHFENEAPKMLDAVGGLPSFEDDKKVLPLQGADLMAWWIRRHIADDMAGVPRLEFPWEGTDQIPCVRSRFDAMALRDAYDEMVLGLPNKRLLSALGLWP